MASLCPVCLYSVENELHFQCVKCAFSYHYKCGGNPKETFTTREMECVVCSGGFRKVENKPQILLCDFPLGPISDEINQEIEFIMASCSGEKCVVPSGASMEESLKYLESLPTQNKKIDSDKLKIPEESMHPTGMESHGHSLVRPRSPVIVEPVKDFFLEKIFGKKEKQESSSLEDFEITMWKLKEDMFTNDPSMLKITRWPLLNQHKVMVYLSIVAESIGVEFKESDIISASAYPTEFYPPGPMFIEFRDEEKCKMWMNAYFLCTKNQLDDSREILYENLPL